MITLLSVLLFTGSALANITPGDGLLIFNAGYANGKSATTGDNVDGNIISLTYERLDWGKAASFGFNIGYSSLAQETTEGSDPVNRTITTWPFYFGGKGYVGQGALQPYLGVALGIFFSTLKTSVGESGDDFTSVTRTGWGMAVPVGLTLAIGKTLFLNGNYTLNWLWSNNYFENDIMHVVNVGLGINLGK
jgi:hypothetical protein